MTDPIVFSNKREQLGLIDWGPKGMDTWMSNHECNAICNKIPMEKDEALIKKLNGYLQRF